MIFIELFLQAEEVPTLLQSKSASKYAGAQLDAMKTVAAAYKNRSLKEFEQALKTYAKELELDPIIKSHLNELYQTLLEQNLARIIEPFSRVEISHVAELINLPINQIEQKYNFKA